MLGDKRKPTYWLYYIARAHMYFKAPHEACVVLGANHHHHEMLTNQCTLPLTGVSTRLFPRSTETAANPKPNSSTHKRRQLGRKRQHDLTLKQGCVYMHALTTCVTPSHSCHQASNNQIAGRRAHTLLIYRGCGGVAGVHSSVSRVACLLWTWPTLARSFLASRRVKCCQDSIPSLTAR